MYRHLRRWSRARGIVAASAVYALAWLAPSAVRAQEPDQSVDKDSAAVRDKSGSVGYYQYVIEDGTGKNGSFRLEVKQGSRSTPPVVTVNGQRVELDSAGSKRIDLPNGGHVTISQDARGQLTVEDGSPNRLFAWDGDFSRAMQRVQQEMLRIQEEVQRVQPEFLRAQEELQRNLGRMWQNMPDATLHLPPDVCEDSTTTPGAER